MKATSSLLPGAYGIVALSLLTSACGPKQPAEEPEPEEEVDERPRDDGMTMMQEKGGMNEDKVTRKVKEIFPDLTNCLQDQFDRQEFLTGEVKFFVQVNLEGRAINTFIEQSDFGNYEGEKCIMEVLRATTWPKPVGGKIGDLHQSASWLGYEDQHVPDPFSQADVQEFLDEDENRELVNECNSNGQYTITAYIENDGRVSSAGVSHTVEGGDETAACLVNAVEQMKITIPVSLRGKATFRL